MNHTERRTKLRVLLTGSQCASAASVYDPLSARVAQAAGFQFGLLMGSVASSTILGAPDLVVLTLTELADQARRITRVSKLSLMVDADHGYGNALNVMRTVQELEHAGVAGLTIEDTALPMAFGQVLVGERFGHAESGDRLVSIEEGVGKMRAAIAARSDPSLVLVARTSALKVEGIESAVIRAKAYAAAGVDAIWVAGQPEKLEAIQAIHAASRLPIMLGAGRAGLKHDELAACGVRFLSQFSQAFAVAVKALHETYTHLFNGGAPADLKSKIASPEQMDQLVDGENYKLWLREYMR